MPCRALSDFVSVPVRMTNYPKCSQLVTLSIAHGRQIGIQHEVALQLCCFRPPIWDLLMLQLLRPNSSNLPCLYSTFHLEYPLVLSRFCFVWGSTRSVTIYQYIRISQYEISVAIYRSFSFFLIQLFIFHSIPVLKQLSRRCISVTIIPL